MNRITSDLSRFPLVVFTVEGDITSALIELHLREYRALLDRKVHYTVLFDAMKAKSADAQVRKRYAEFISANADDLKQYCKGTALVFSSSIVRGALTAVLWMVPLPFPHKVFDGLNEASQWLNGL